MDIKEKINEIVDKVKNDKEVTKNFQKDPVKTVEGLVGVDLPNDQVNQIVDAVKAKVSFDKLGDTIGGIFGKK